jgi:hypothetical protein
MTEDDRMAHEQLFRRVEMAHQRNRRAIEASLLREARLERAAQQSTRVVESALRKLRAGM